MNLDTTKRTGNYSMSKGDDSPMISVIVPVYNAELSLAKCVNSILSQSFKDFELILVNDGSKDSSGNICDKYQQLDNRVKVFHKENGGVSSARNLGLDNAKGEWIAFIDSDDWVSTTYLLNLVEDIDEQNHFIMHGRHSRGHNRNADNKLSIFNVSEREALFEKLQITPNGQPWSKLFRHSIIQINNLRFNHRVTLSEDTLFILQYLSFIDTVKYRSLYNYFYEYVDESLSTTSKVNYDSNIEGFKVINEILSKNFQLKSLKEFPTLRVTYFGFFSRAIRALNVNGYDKETRLQGYKDLKDAVHFPLISQEYTRSKTRGFLFNLFMESHYKLYDFFMYKAYNRGKITSYIHSKLKK